MASSTPPRLPLGPSPAKPARPNALTVAELNATIQTLLQDRFGEVWVRGEISNLKRASSGHFYFSLKDADAQVRCVLFRGTARFQRFEPTDGLGVVVRATLEVFTQRGEYQLTVQYMEPLGKGSLHLAFEQLKEKLRVEGLFDPARKRPLPLLPQRIGIVTSPTGAAIRDVLRVLERRFENLHVTIYPARVQGEGSVKEVVEGIQALGRLGCFDVLLLCRGGGSIEDLWTFNEEAVARAISASPIPTISAIGHEVDFTIADFVADVRAPTPSAAAEMVVKSKDDLKRHQQALAARLLASARRSVELRRSRLQGLQSHRALERPRSLLSMRRQVADELAERATRAARARLGELRGRTRGVVARLALADPRRALARRGERLAALRGRLLAAEQAALRSHRHRLGAATGALPRLGAELTRHRRHRVQALVQNLGHLSPLAVLERGYAIVRTGPEPEAPVIRRARDARAGQRLHVRLSEGDLSVRVAPRDARPGATGAQPTLFDTVDTKEDS